MVSPLKTSEEMAEAKIYAGRHEVYFDSTQRLVDTMQAVSDSGTMVCVHISPDQDDYEICGLNMAREIKKRGLGDSFEIVNGYLFDREKQKPIKIDGVSTSNRVMIRGVEKSKLLLFRRGLIKILAGVRE
jgi:hypothetical protein